MAFGDNWEQMANRGADQYSDEWRKSKKDKRIEELTAQVEALSAEIKALREELAHHYGSQSNTVIELVDAAFACPKCGNREMDWLPIDLDTEMVTCGRCGMTYDPSEVTA